MPQDLQNDPPVFPPSWWALETPLTPCMARLNQDAKSGARRWPRRDMKRDRVATLAQVFVTSSGLMGTII